MSKEKFGYAITDGDYKYTVIAESRKQAIKIVSEHTGMCEDYIKKHLKISRRWAQRFDDRVCLKEWLEPHELYEIEEADNG